MRKLLLVFISFPTLSFAGDFGIGLHAGFAKNSIQSYGAINNGLSYAFDFNYTTKRIYTGIRTECVSVGNGVAYTVHGNYRFNSYKRLHPYAGIAVGYSAIQARPIRQQSITTGGTGFCGGVQVGATYYISRRVSMQAEMGTRMGKLKINNVNKTTADGALPIIKEIETNGYAQNRYSTSYIRIGFNFSLYNRKKALQKTDIAPVEKKAKAASAQ